MKETFKIEDQSYYIEPPYAYRPSVVEYLTKMKVTKNGIIADILHLDKKKKIRIIEYLKDGLVIELVELKNADDLNYNELMLYGLIESKISKGKAVVKFSDLDKISKDYEALVVQNIGGKFGSRLIFKPVGALGFAVFGFFVSIGFGIVNYCLMLPISLIFFLSHGYCGRFEFSKSYNSCVVEFRVNSYWYNNSCNIAPVFNNTFYKPEKN